MAWTFSLIAQKKLYWLSSIVLSFIAKCIQRNLSFNSMDLRSGKEPKCDWRSSRKDALGPNRRFHTHSVIFTKAQEKGPLGLWLNVKEHFVDERFHHISLMLERPSLTFWKYWYINLFAKWLERKHLTVSLCRTRTFSCFHNCQLVKYGKTSVSLYFFQESKIEPALFV